MSKPLRIFVSSPDDVKDERSIVKDIIERMRIEYEAYFDLEPILWENEAIVATGGFQDSLVEPGTCDIVLVIFWSKLGTPLPKKYFHGMTGTEWEFINAIERATKQNGTPQVLVFRKDAPMVGNFFDDDAVREVRTNKEQLDAFFQKHFFNPDGSFKRAYRTFQDQNEFANLVETQLHKLLDERKGAEGQRIVWKASPFRGLKPFEFEHHAIFFGRDQAKRYLLKRLAKQVERGIAFVMVQAMSGSGKSSLVKAGLLPQLTTPRVIGDVVCIRWCLLRPSDGDGNPLRALARAIHQPNTLGDALAAYDVNEEYIIKTFTTDPALLKPSLQIALGKIAEEEYRADVEAIRLVIVVDQFEELFSNRRIPHELKESFVKALDVLARSGMVWVIGTMRSDFLHETEAYPELQALMEGDGQFHLFPPRPEETEQMIQEPARLAGLAFEVRDQTSLDEILLRDTTQQQGALPLLEFTLDALYERRDGNILTFAAYEAIGGIAGAVADRAEKVYRSLPANTRKALSSVFRALVTIDPSANEKATARRADWAQLASVPENKAFVEAFIQAHLLVSDKASIEEKQVVWVAHEALLRNWPRVADWVESNIEDLRVRGRLAEAAALWEKEGRNDQYLLPEGKPFAEAKDLFDRIGAELEERERAFIIQSEQRILATQSKERRKKQIVTSLALLTLLAVGGLYLTFNFSQLAIRTMDATKLVKANEAVNRGNTPNAISLAQQATTLPRRSSSVLSRAMANNHLIAMVNKRPTNPETQSSGGFSASFSPNLNRVITIAEQSALTLWRLHEFRFTEQRTFHPDDTAALHTAIFTPDGNHIIGISDNGTWIIPADSVETVSVGSSPAFSCGAGVDAQIAASPNGRWAALVHKKNNDGIWLCLMDLQQPGRIAAEIMIHKKPIRSLTFSPDSQTLATASEDNTVCLLPLSQAVANGSDHQIACTRLPLGQIVNRAKFDSSSRRLATASVDGPVRIYDLDGRLLQKINDKEADTKVHHGAVRDVAFSNDGKAIVTVGDDARVIYWDLTTDTPSPRVLGVHDLGIEHVEFSPDGSTILTASRDRTARLWDPKPVPRGRPVILEHLDNVTFAGFSADGRRIGTVSDDGTARVWNREAVKRLSALQEKHTSHVWDVAFRPQQKGLPQQQQVTLATTSYDWTARIWTYDFDANLDSTVWRLTAAVVLEGHQGRVRSARFNHNGDIIATAAYDGTARLWNLEGTPLCVMQSESPKQDDIEVTNVFFGPKDDWLLTAANQKQVNIWSLSNCNGENSPECQCTLAKTLEHDSSVRAVAVGLNTEKEALAASADRSHIRIWKPKDGWEQQCRMAVDNKITDLRFSPNLGLLAGADENGTATLWNTKSCKPVAHLKNGHDDLIYSIRFDPDGKRLITASQDRTAVIWALDGKVLATLVGHGDRVYFAEFNNDGQWAVTASRDGTARIWKTAPGTDGEKNPWMLLEGNRGGVSHATFSPDSRFVAAAYWNNAAELWYVLEDGKKPVVDAFAKQVSRENRLDAWVLRKRTKRELTWWEEAKIVLKRLRKW
jgi:WD40 repeat protein